MITSRKFTANLKTLSKHVVELRNTMIDSVEFALFHGIRHGNKKPAEQLKLAANALPVWAGDILTRAMATIGKADATYTEDRAKDDAVKLVMHGFMDKAEADKKRKEQRDKLAAAKKAKAEAEKKAAKSNPPESAPAKGPQIGQGSAKPSAGKKPNAKPSVVTSPNETFCLKHGEEVLELSQGEYETLVAQLMKLRRAPAKTA